MGYVIKIKGDRAYRTNGRTWVPQIEKAMMFTGRENAEAYMEALQAKAIGRTFELVEVK